MLPAIKQATMSAGSDSKFFSGSQKKGELHELKQELHSTNLKVKSDGVKKVIANMTIGKDVSPLFTSVLNCIQTPSIELKKLVYLYLINYSKSQPELALLAVNTFVKDANDPNPLIRALAVRTMGCIRVERITEYLCEPLSKSLRDEDPYVRKTAAICVAKLYDISPTLVEERGFLDVVHDLISDSNPSVVANAVASLSEIADVSGKDVLVVTTSVLQKLLAALNECTEWGQVFILDSLAKYTPLNEIEAEKIIERVSPRLQHANSAVVMSAVKVILSYMPVIKNSQTKNNYERKLAPPLVTLLNSEPEIQYVALRNINLIVQQNASILEKEVKVFFCKYNDPIYVKMEKLEIIIKLVTEKNVEQVLLEFKEYATEVDVDFVRRSVSAIGRCAIKLERSAERCISVLLELIQTKVNYVVQESVIVIKDIFRRYPNRYESIIATLCENLDTLDEPEAKASMIWIIGEYAERISNADELLSSFLETFEEEDTSVQLQLLTATVKCFLKHPEDTQDMVQRVLDMATEESDNPDLRDRGFVYWRLLSTDPEAAKAVVLSEKPVIHDDTFMIEEGLLEELIGQIATLASIYHKPPSSFVAKASGGGSEGNENEDEEGSEGGDYDYEDENDVGSNSNDDNNNNNNGGSYSSSGEVDLLDMGMGDMTVSETNNNNNTSEQTSNDLFGFSSDDNNDNNTLQQQAQKITKVQVCGADKSGGIDVYAGFGQTSSGDPILEMDFTNRGTSNLAALAIQFNKNAFGLSPGNQQIIFNPPIQPGSSGSNTIALTVTPSMMVTPAAGQMASPTIQAAIKNMGSGNVFYFATPMNMEVIFGKDGSMDKNEFITMWKGIEESKEVLATVNDIVSDDIDVVIQKFASNKINFIARRAVPDKVGQEVAYFSCKSLGGLTFLGEFTFKKGVRACKVCVKSEAGGYVGLAKEAFERCLK